MSEQDPKHHEGKKNSSCKEAVTYACTKEEEGRKIMEDNIHEKIKNCASMFFFH